MQNATVSTNLPINFDRSKNFDFGEKRSQSFPEKFAAEAVPHFHVLRRYALHLVRNQTEADDLVQETFAQALKSFDRYEMGTNCRAWLCKIMFHKRSQWIRANARFRQFDEGETHFPAAFAHVLPAGFYERKTAALA